MKDEWATDIRTLQSGKLLTPPGFEPGSTDTNSRVLATRQERLNFGEEKSNIGLLVKDVVGL